MSSPRIDIGGKSSAEIRTALFASLMAAAAKGDIKAAREAAKLLNEIEDEEQARAARAEWSSLSGNPIGLARLAGRNGLNPDDAAQVVGAPLARETLRAYNLGQQERLAEVRAIERRTAARDGVIPDWMSSYYETEEP